LNEILSRVLQERQIQGEVFYIEYNFNLLGVLCLSVCMFLAGHCYFLKIKNYARKNGMIVDHSRVVKTNRTFCNNGLYPPDEIC
jgi:ubiquitin C-terminal hydrolase